MFLAVYSTQRLPNFPMLANTERAKQRAFVQPSADVADHGKIGQGRWAHKYPKLGPFMTTTGYYGKIGQIW